MVRFSRIFKDFGLEICPKNILIFVKFWKSTKKNNIKIKAGLVYQNTKVCKILSCKKVKGNYFLHISSFRVRLLHVRNENVLKENFSKLIFSVFLPLQSPKSLLFKKKLFSSLHSLHTLMSKSSAI